MDVERPFYECDDCGRESNRMSPEAIAAGGVTRDPGEKVCGGCSSRRVLMVRAVEALPSTLDRSQAKSVMA